MAPQCLKYVQSSPFIEQVCQPLLRVTILKHPVFLRDHCFHNTTLGKREWERGGQQNKTKQNIKKAHAMVERAEVALY